MQPRHAFRRHDAARILLKAGQFDPVSAEKLKQFALGCKPVQIAGAGRQIDLRLHEILPAFRVFPAKST
jgi:hypothetical protein